MPDQRQRRNRSLLLALPCAVLVGGCSVAKSLRAEAGTDLKPIQIAATRVHIERTLGTPARSWESAGVRFSVYRYDAGAPPSMAGAATFAFLDVATLGAWELFASHLKIETERVVRQIAIGYDARDQVVCILPDFSDLQAIDPKKCNADR